MSSLTIGLVADDLTGANDTAVQFARRGWDALLLLDPESGIRLKLDTTSGSVLALTTDSRALPNDAAERLTARAVTQLIAAGAARVYLKIDSTMRGSIAGQIAGALNAWRTKHPHAGAVVCPAYPRMGRTVVANHLLVGGERVERTAIGSDPMTPVKTGDLAVLIPESKHVSVNDLALTSQEIQTVDARWNEDLSVLARAVERIGPAAIPVGSAGLADAMAEVWGGGTTKAVPPGFGRASTAHILVQVTSLHPVSRAQIERLQQVFPEITVLSGRADEVSAELVERFANRHWDLLGLIGGDGARAALDRLGASAIRVVGAHVEGIPLGLVVGGKADGMPVFTKAGGFGAEDALVRLIEGLRR